MALISIAKLETKADRYLYTIGEDEYETGIITKFARTLLDDVTAYEARQTLNALGKDEQAASAVEADTAENCVGNSASADKLSIARRINITDCKGQNIGDDTTFDGSASVRLKMPNLAVLNIEGNATTADHFRVGRELVVNVGSNARVEYTAEKATSLGVEGILRPSNGGTGESDLKKAWVGKAGSIENNMDDVDNLMYASLNGDFFRIRVDKNNATNTGCLEIATGDDANEAVYVRQYYGEFDTIHRTLILLDEFGNTSLPGELTMHSLILPNKASASENSIWIE